MNYLLDKKIKRNKFLKFVLVFIVLFFLIYFRSSVFHGLSATTHFVFRPVLVLGNSVGEKLKNVGTYFLSKQTLENQNENLSVQLQEMSTRTANYNSILDENNQMKEILGRKNQESSMILSGILAKPNQSPYDTLLIDAGSVEGVALSNTVFAFGSIPVGYVAEVLGHSSKVILFSTPGEQTQVVVALPGTGESRNVFQEVVGRGGGNFEMMLPRDFVLEKGVEVVLPGINPYVVAIVEDVISDPRSSFKKILLVSPVNIQELKFVEVEK